MLRYEIDSAGWMLMGCARVSGRLQETHLQLDALEKAGVEKIHQEKARSIGDRSQLRRCISEMQKGDILLVWKLDRVARSLRDLLTTLEALQTAGCGFGVMGLKASQSR